MSDSDCKKKQTQVKGGQTFHKCIHRKADTFREQVTDDVCAACPLRVYAAKRKPTQRAGKLPVLDNAEGYPLCEYRAAGFCTVSGLPVTPEQCNSCAQESAKQEATLDQKFHNYKAAIRKWVASGMPIRTQEEVDAIHDEHCIKCEKYDPVAKACKSCGCKVNKGVFPLSNKLKMKTEKCPLGRFK